MASHTFTTQLGTLVTLLFSLIFTGCNSTTEMIVVTPIESSETLLNPGRGFTTTSIIFNSDLADRLHPQSGVHQVRWYWDVLEPEEGNINYVLIDSVLKRSISNGQRLNFRVMCQDVEMKIPDWAMDQGITPPYYDNLVFLEKQSNLIRALGERYDGHPALAFMDIGTVGQWGEWHSEENSDVQVPNDANARKIVDMYVESFQQTPLVMLIGGSALAYAIEQGTGWRADCWGDYGDEWKHMEIRYPAIFEATTNLHDAWKSAPVALETCWTIDHWYDQGWDIDVTLAKALEWRTTSVNNGTYPIPEAWWPKIREFEKKLGYRFVLNHMTYPSSINIGETLAYTMSWENKGVAPIYQPFSLAVRLVSKSDKKEILVIKTEDDITQWMPGITTLNSSIELPNSIASGAYELQLGIISNETKAPRVRLAIEGVNDEGWYSIGRLLIKN